MTPAGLAAQVPPEVKRAIQASVDSSNSKTNDDTKGGHHEESLKWGKDSDGNTVVSPSVPGPYAPPGTNPHTNFTPADPGVDQRLVTVDGFAHVHPRGGDGESYVQPPSQADRDAARGYNAINIVVGAGNKTVYFYRGSDVNAKPVSMSLQDFMKGP
jgi:hypothetical protein